MGINEVKSYEKLWKMVGRNAKYMQFVVNVLKHAKPPLSYPIIMALHGMFCLLYQCDSSVVGCGDMC